MTLDEEIFLAKKEKETREKISELLEGLNFADDSAENILMIKYSENAEFLREYPYFDKLRECLEHKINPSLVEVLWEHCREMLDMTDSKDVNTIKESYTSLAEIYISLEEASDAFGRAYENGGEDFRKYIASQVEKLQKKNPSLTQQEAQDEAERRFEKRAHNIHVHTGKVDRPFTGPVTFPAQIKKY